MEEDVDSGGEEVVKHRTVCLRDTGWMGNGAGHGVGGDEVLKRPGEGVG